MKRFIGYAARALAGALLMAACGDDEPAVPGQPDFIAVGLEAPYTVRMGDSFELSVPEESGAENYFWSLPEMLNVIEGENTSRLLVAGLVEGVIPAGVITVEARNAAGASAPRTLWKEITVTGLPPRPAYVQTSIVGSLTVDLDEEFAVYVPEDDQVATYAWSVPEALTVVSGGDTERVVLKANRKSVNIPANSISVTTVSRTGLSETHRFEKMICVLPTDGYPAKRYGTKTWMTVNLNYAGEDGSVGRTAPDDPDGSKYGRYYTWAEAMTGLSAGENPYVYGASGTDDMGNSYTLNNGVASYNIQVRGICPEGWHVPNAYDFYDLAAGVADDYGLRMSSISGCGGGNLYARQPRDEPDGRHEYGRSRIHRLLPARQPPGGRRRAVGGECQCRGRRHDVQSGETQRHLPGGKIPDVFPRCNRADRVQYPALRQIYGR